MRVWRHWLLDGMTDGRNVPAVAGQIEMLLLLLEVVVVGDGEGVVTVACAVGREIRRTAVDLAAGVRPARQGCRRPLVA